MIRTIVGGMTGTIIIIEAVIEINIKTDLYKRRLLVEQQAIYNKWCPKLKCVQMFDYKD
jgi:hypothetical protein